jgi:excisionase family DNA binding protein
MTSPWLTVQEAAAYARRSEKTIYRWVESGALVASYPDRWPLIKQSDLDKFIEHGKNKRKVSA